MRLHPSLVGAIILTCLFVIAPPSAEAAKTVRGLFGDRTLGGPVAPQPRTRFDSGLQRSPSGSFLGLQRDQQFSRERPALRSSIPDVPWSMTTPVPPAPPRIAPYEPRWYPEPSRTRPQPSLQPQRPPDMWFRTPAGPARRNR